MALLSTNPTPFQPTFGGQLHSGYASQPIRKVWQPAQQVLSVIDKARLLAAPQAAWVGEPRHVGRSMTFCLDALPRGVSLQDLQRMGQYAKDRLNAAYVRLTNRPDGHTIVELPVAQSRDILIDGNRAVLSGVKVMLGPLITEPGSTILNLDDAKSQHILMVASLTERTMLLRALWYQLVRQNRPNALRFMVIDPESVLPISVQNSAHLLCRPVQRCEDQTDDLLQLEIRHALQTVAREIQQRRLRSSNYPHLVVVITNITPLLKRPGLLSLLNHIIEQGREVSVHVVGGTSDITHFTLKHPLIQNNFKARLVGQMPDSATSDLACGAPDFFCEWGMGDGDITYTLTHQRFQCGIVSDGELKFLPRAIGLPSIWNMGAS